MSQISKKIEAIREKYKNRRVNRSTSKAIREYAAIYSWALTDDKDPYYVFCKFCDCRISAKSSNVARHENSIRHKTNTKDIDKSYMKRDGVHAIPESHKSSGNFNMSSYCNEEYGEHSYAHNESLLPTNTTGTVQLAQPMGCLMEEKSVSTTTDTKLDEAVPVPVEPSKIMIKVTGAKPKSVSPLKSTATITPLHMSTQQYHEFSASPPHRSNYRVKDSFDLFFESICATVKGFPAKLATEGKMRVMQLIGVLELRAIEERDRHMATASDPTQI